MKITFIGHASLLIETKKITILSDPWYDGPCFGAQWWTFPLPLLEPLKKIDFEVNYIYISHDHHDHLHPVTLKRFKNKKTKIIVCEGTKISNKIAKLGFQVITLKDGENTELENGVKCRIQPTSSLDSYMVIDDGSKVCVNYNDALDDFKWIDLTRSHYKKIDFAFIGNSGIASYFPNCIHYPSKDNLESARIKQYEVNAGVVNFIKRLQPTWAFPFASLVVFLEPEMFPINEAFISIPSVETLWSKIASNYPSQVQEIGPGTIIDDTGISHFVQKASTSNDNILKAYEPVHKVLCKTRRNQNWEALTQILELINQSISNKKPFLSSFSGNYKMRIIFRNLLGAIEINKQDTLPKHKRIYSSPSLTPQEELDASIFTTRIIVNEFEPSEFLEEEKKRTDFVLYTRLPYVKSCLKEKIGRQLITTGSGGQHFYLNDRSLLCELHFEMLTIIHEFYKKRLHSRYALGNRYLKLRKGRYDLLTRTKRLKFGPSEWSLWKVYQMLNIKTEVSSLVSTSPEKINMKCKLKTKNTLWSYLKKVRSTILSACKIIT